MSNSLFYVVGENGTVLKSVDGGITWQSKAVPTSVDLQSVWVFDLNKVVVAGKNGVILESTNGGDTWVFRTAFDSSGTNPITDGVIRNLVFVDANTGFAIAATPSINRLIKTTDGGIRYDEVADVGVLGNANAGLGGPTVNGALGYRQGPTGLVYPTPTQGYFSGGPIPFTGGYAVYSVDQNGGNITAEQLLLGNLTPLGLHFISASTGWHSDSNGNIQKTVDFGSNWSVINTAASVASNPLTSIIDLGNANEVLAVGHAGKIVRVVTTGAINAVLTSFSPTANNLKKVCRNADGEIIAVGNNGTIITSTNQGSTFQIRSSGVSVRLWSCHGVASSVVCGGLTSGAQVTHEGILGAEDGQIIVTVQNGTGPFEYSKDNGANFQGGDTFSNLAAGVYNIVTRDTATGCEVLQIIQIDPGTAAHNVVLLPTPVSASGLSDGQIETIVAGGFGPFTFLWNDANTDQHRTGLAAGTYTVDVTDTLTGIVVQATATVEDPELVVPVQPLLKIPDTNSIRFHLQQAVDNCVIMENPLNTLEKARDLPAFKKVCYTQMFAKCDKVTTQFKSNYADHQVNLLRQDGTVFNTYEVLKVVDNLAQVQEFDADLQDHGGNQIRVFWSAVVAQDIEIGDAIEISDTATLNGIYLVVDKQYDAVQMQNYFVINATFPAGPSEIDATGAVASSDLPYNVYEFEIDFDLVDEGYYKVQVLFIDPDFGTYVANSEWVNIREKHEDVALIKWRNEGIKFGINYNTGIEHLARVPARMVESLPQGTRTVFRRCDSSIKKINASMSRRWRLSILQVPYYVHEILALAFEHSYFEVNGLEYQTEDGYGEPQYIDLYNLSNSSVIIEQVGWLEELFRPLEGTDADPAIILPGGIYDNTFDDSFE